VSRTRTRREAVGKTFWFTSDHIGIRDELGRVLMRNFVYSLARTDDRPERLMFMNTGVLLTCEGSEVLDQVRLLADSGVVVKSCGTCLDYLRMTDKLAVGEIGDMNGSVAALAGASDVVTVA
jgi:selenium metabolism protein YedF